MMIRVIVLLDYRLASRYLQGRATVSSISRFVLISEKQIQHAGPGQKQDAKIFGRSVRSEGRAKLMVLKLAIGWGGNDSHYDVIFNSLF